MRWNWKCGIIIVATCALTAGSAQAQIESQLGVVAKNLAGNLQAAGHSSATLKVNGPTVFPSSGPALVKEVLGAELLKLGITVKKLRADAGVVADLKITEVKDEGSNTVSAIALSLVMNIVDRNESPIASIDPLKINVTDRSDVSRMLGVPFETPSVPPGGGAPAGGAAALVAAITNPEQAVQGSVIRAKEDGQFGLEVLVGGTGRPAVVEEGFAMVELSKSDKCEIRLVNDAPYEVGVRLSLDGCDCFWFSKQKLGYWIVGPKSTMVVKGWQLNNNQAREFAIVPFEHSVAAEAGITGEVGVISASFYKSYQDHETIPVNDNPPPTKSLGVGAGNLLESAVKSVKRKFGQIRACVPVRYEKPQQ